MVVVSNRKTIRLLRSPEKRQKTTEIAFVAYPLIVRELTNYFVS